jgi:hypothetical protein
MSSINETARSCTACEKDLLALFTPTLQERRFIADAVARQSA